MTIVLCIQWNNCIKRGQSSWFLPFLYKAYLYPSKNYFAFVFCRIEETKISCLLQSLQNIPRFQKVNLDYLYGSLHIWQPFYTSIKSHSYYNNDILIACPTIKNLNHASKLFRSWLVR